MNQPILTDIPMDTRNSEVPTQVRELSQAEADRMADEILQEQQIDTRQRPNSDDRF